jgi:hypothetical protein
MGRATLFPGRHPKVQGWQACMTVMLLPTKIEPQGNE